MTQFAIFLLLLLPILLAILSLAPLISMGVYLLQVLKPTVQTYYSNQIFGLYLTTLVLFFVLHAIYQYFFYRFTTKRFQKWMFIYPAFDFLYFLVTSIVAICLITNYAIGKRIDGAVWSSIVLVAILFNVGIIFYYLIKYAITRKLQQANQELYSELEHTYDMVHKNHNIAKNVASCLAFSISHVCKCFALILMLLLSLGALILGFGTLLYPPRGSFVMVNTGDETGRAQKVLFHCDGPKNDSLPVFLFEGDGSHGIGDYLGIQSLMVQAGRRSCIWDKPGLGYSDYLFSDQKDYSKMYHNLITSLNEKGPFVFVAFVVKHFLCVVSKHCIRWGGGAEIVYPYAKEHPEMVKSLVLLDAYPINIEFRAQQVLKNWTIEQYESSVAEAREQRLQIVNIINRVGVPFGLMGVLLPPSGAQPAQFQNEQRWYFLTEKTWISQTKYIDQMQPYPFDPFNSTISDTIPVHMVLTTKSDKQVKEQICIPRGLEPDSADCQYEIKSNEYYIQAAQKMVPANGGKLIPCNLDACSQSYLIYEGPQFTVDALVQLYP